MELSCRQCGKRAVSLCPRSDCWATKENIAVETARRNKEVAKAGFNVSKLEVMAFNANFKLVSDWAERIGAQHPNDRDAIRHMGKETVRAAEVYAAIARSL